MTWLVVFLLAVIALLAGLLVRRRRQLNNAHADLATAERALAEADAAKESSSQLLGLLVGRLPMGVATTDVHRRVTRWNAACERLFTVSAPEAEGRSLMELVQDADVETVLRACLASGRPEERSVTVGYSRRALLVTAHPIQSNGEGIVGAVVFFQDVTELSRLQTIRREFVANISHELRTPITSVKLMVETLLGGAMRDEQTARAFLLRMAEEVERLGQLVRELLELSYIESGKQRLEISPVDIGGVLSQIATAFSQQAERKGIRLEVNVAPEASVVPADEQRIRQVVSNLVDNAIKFTPREGMVSLATSAHEGHALISVADTGAGIAHDELERIFERFYKAEKARRREGGTGLGLAIAKHIVQAHGGQIWAESEEGKGAVFRFTLPRSVPHLQTG